MRKFGFEGNNVGTEMFNVYKIAPDGKAAAEKMGTYKGAEVKLKAQLEARAVVLLKVVKSN